ncbi:hypothetical protein DBR14_10515, partial [Pseudomonas sp. HMWF034]
WGRFPAYRAYKYESGGIMANTALLNTEDPRWELACCGEGACSRSTAQLEPAFGGASHPSASKLARHSKPAPTV